MKYIFYFFKHDSGIQTRLFRFCLGSRDAETRSTGHWFLRSAARVAHVRTNDWAVQAGRATYGCALRTGVTL